MLLLRASEPEASERCSSPIGAVGSQKVSFKVALDRGREYKYSSHYHVFNLIIGDHVGDTKHSLILFVCILSDIFYFNLASVLDAVGPRHDQ